MNVFDWLSHMGIPEVDNFDIVEVKFKGGRKEYYRNVDFLALNTGDPVVVDVPSGHHIGYVSLQGELVRLQMQKRKIRNDDEILRIYRVANQKDMEKLKKFAEFTKGKISKDFENDVNQIGKLREVVDTGLRTLSTIDSTPKTYRPLRDFAIEKSAETFANVAQSAYQNYGNKAPVISIENPPAGRAALSRGQDLKDMVEKTPATVKEGVAKEEAEGVKKQLEEAGATVELK